MPRLNLQPPGAGVLTTTHHLVRILIFNAWYSSTADHYRTWKL